MLFLTACGSGCYVDDMTALKVGTPYYSSSQSFSVAANGNYATGKNAAYGQWLPTGVQIDQSIKTSINVKVSGEVSMCNGRSSSLYGTKSNVVSDNCTICSNYSSAAASSSGDSVVTPPEVCASGCGAMTGGTCLTYCNEYPGGTCPYGQSAKLPEYCDGNCVKGSKYFIPGNQQQPTILTYNVLPNDKVTLFVDAPNLCGSLSELNSGVDSSYPDANRYSRASPTAGYPETIVCNANSDTLSADVTAGLCEPTQNNDVPIAAGDKLCWITTGTGLGITLDGNACLTTTQNQNVCFAISDTSVVMSNDPLYSANSTNNNTAVQFNQMGGSPGNQYNANDPSSSPYTCQSVTRVIYNSTNSTINTIAANVMDTNENYSDNHGGYTVYVKHESCRSVNGLGHGSDKAGALQLGLFPDDCVPNVSPGKSTPPQCSNPVVITLGGNYQVNNCNHTDTPCTAQNVFCPAWPDCSETDGYTYYSLDLDKDFHGMNGTLWAKVIPPSSGYNVDNATGTLDVAVGYGTDQEGGSKLVADIMTYFTYWIYSSLKQQFTNIICTGDIGSCQCDPSVSDCSMTYIGYIRALLVLYISLYGIMFIMGMVQISQGDLVVRIFKIGLIVALTQPDAWTFFYDNFFALFLDGGATLINMAMNNAFVAEVKCNCIPTASVTGAPSVVGMNGDTCPANYIKNPFCFIDYGFRVLFLNPMIWKKLATYLFLGPLTFIIFWFMLYGIVLYALAIFDAIIKYMMSVIGIAILLLLAPIFIPCVLFSRTSSLFENWLKYLINYTLAPVFLIIGLNIITMIMYLCIEQALNFSVCWDCAFNIQLPEYLAKLAAGSDKATICLKWFVPFGYGPNGAGSSLEALGLKVTYFIFFVILLNLLKNFGSYVENIVQRISGLRLQQFVTGTGNSGRGGGMLGALKGAGATLIGQDEQSKARRAARADARLNARSSDAEVDMDDAKVNATKSRRSTSELKPEANTSSKLVGKVDEEAATPVVAASEGGGDSDSDSEEDAKATAPRVGVDPTSTGGDKE